MDDDDEVYYIFSCRLQKWRDRDRNKRRDPYRSAPLYSIVPADLWTPVCPRRKLTRAKSFSSVFVVMDFIITRTPNVCVSFSRWKAETRWWWVSSCVPFLSALVALPSFFPPDAFAPPSRVNLYLHARRPTDSALFLRKRRRNAGQNRIDSLMDRRFFFHPGERESSWKCWLTFKPFGCGQPTSLAVVFENCVVGPAVFLFPLWLLVGLSPILCLDLSLLEKSLTFRL